MGVVVLVRPAYVGTFFDVRYDSVDGRREVRAVYGGFGVAMALVLWWAIEDPALRRGVVSALLVRPARGRGSTA